jgi:hypothetical protein
MPENAQRAGRPNRAAACLPIVTFNLDMKL